MGFDYIELNGGEIMKNTKKSVKIMIFNVFYVKLGRVAIYLKHQGWPKNYLIRDEY